MCSWKRWIWPGLLTVGLLSLLGLWMKTETIQNDLRAKATQQLTSAGQSWAQVKMDGRDAIITGQSPSETGLAEAAGIALNVYDVRVVYNRSQLMAAQSPYLFKAKRAGNSVELSGFVPTEQSRDGIKAAAEDIFGDATVTDNLTLARGAPEGFEASAGFGLTQLGQLSTGELTLSDRDMSIVGAATERQAYDDVNSALDGSIAGGAKLAKREITAPAISPYTWAANSTDAGLVLSGYVPDEPVRSTILEQARTALPNTSISDQMIIASGAPENFSNKTGFAFKQLPRFSSGTVSLSDSAFSVSGVAIDPQRFIAANEAVAGVLKNGLTLADAQIVPSTVSPYTWSSDYNGSDLRLSGFAPDDATRESVVSMASSSIPSANIIDDLQIAAGAPDGFGDAVNYSLQQLPRFSSGKVALSDLNIAVEGVANDVVSYTVAKTAVADKLPSNLKLSNENITPSTVSPYTWGGDYDGSDLRLSGFVPDDATRESVVSMASSSIPSANIIDDLQIAAGAPNGFGDAADYSLKQLSRFSSGKVALSDLDLSVEGVANDLDSYSAAKSAIADELPSNLTLSNEAITPSTVTPYTWQAAHDGKEVTLSGFVPDRDTRQGIVDQANALFPNASVDDQMRIAAGVPNSFTEATNFALNTASQLEMGTVSLSDLSLSAEGKAKDTALFEKTISDLKSNLPQGLLLSSQAIEPPTVSPYEWNAAYDGKTVILNGFAPSDSVISDIVSRVKSKLPAAEIDNRMKLATGAPKNYAASILAGVDVLPRLSTAVIDLIDDKLSIVGTGRDSANYVSADRYVRKNLGEGVNLAKAEITPPAADGDYTWSARKVGNSIVLSGLVPNLETRAGLAENAKSRFPGFSVINRTIVATGAPDNFVARADEGLGLLNSLTEGTTTLNNRTLGIVGKAKTVAIYEAVQGAIAAERNDGYVWGKRDIIPPLVSPFNWSIDNTKENTVLSGFVPGIDAGTNNIAASEVALNKETDNQQRVAGGAPEGFGNAVAVLINGVSKVDNGKASITETSVFFEGRSTSEEAADRLSEELRTALPKNYRYRDQISYPLPEPEPEPEPVKQPEAAKVEEPVKVKEPVTVEDPVEVEEPLKVEETVTVDDPVEVEEPQVCSIDFKALFDGEKIQFDTARAVIQPVSFSLLDRIAKSILECENSVVEVGGHTDSRGSGSYNRGLSEARAQSVVSYLAGKDVSEDHLTARGYGEAQPIAPNNLPTERAKNRRIEFRVLEQ